MLRDLCIRRHSIFRGVEKLIKNIVESSEFFLPQRGGGIVSHNILRLFDQNLKTLIVKITMSIEE